MKKDVGVDSEQLYRVELGNRLYNYRTRMRYSQEQIAEIIGIGVCTYRSIENGTRSVTARELAALAQIYGVSMDELYSGRTARSEAAFGLYCYLSDRDKTIVLALIQAMFEADTPHDEDALSRDFDNTMK